MNCFSETSSGTASAEAASAEAASKGASTKGASASAEEASTQGTAGRGTSAVDVFIPVDFLDELAVAATIGGMVVIDSEAAVGSSFV
jgi:hypothetical protein